EGEAVAAHGRQHGKAESEGAGGGLDDMAAGMQAPVIAGAVEHEARRHQLHEGEAGGMEIGGEAHDARRLIGGGEILGRAHGKTPRASSRAKTEAPAKPASRAAPSRAAAVRSAIEPPGSIRIPMRLPLWATCTPQAPCSSASLKAAARCGFARW